MFRSYVRFRLPSGEIADACPGDLVGRLWSAAIRLDDARVSEAHALISLRGSELKLLALRGALGVGGLRVMEVTLKPGLQVELAEGISLKVEAVELPRAALAVQGLGPWPQILTASSYSLLAGPPIRLLAQYLPDANGHIWTTGDEWRAQLPDQDPVVLEAGSKLRVGETVLELVEVPLVEMGIPGTLLKGRLYSPFQLIARYESVHIHRDSQPSVVLGGMPARILSELATFAAPVPWETVAGELWRNEEDRISLRQRWDRNLASLRAKLRGAKLRPDLVKSDGKGNIELLLYPGDKVLDES